MILREVKENNGKPRFSSGTCRVPVGFRTQSSLAKYVWKYKSDFKNTRRDQAFLDSFDLACFHPMWMEQDFSLFKENEISESFKAGLWIDSYHINLPPLKLWEYTGMFLHVFDDTSTKHSMAAQYVFVSTAWSKGPAKFHSWIPRRYLWGLSPSPCWHALIQHVVW